MKTRIMIILAFNLMFALIGFYLGIMFYEAHTEPVIEEIHTLEVRIQVFPFERTEPATLEETIAYLSHARQLHQQWADKIGTTGYPLDAYSGGRSTQLQMVHDYDRILSYLDTLEE